MCLLILFIYLVSLERVFIKMFYSTITETGLDINNKINIMNKRSVGPQEELELLYRKE